MRVTKGKISSRVNLLLVIILCLNTLAITSCTSTINSAYRIFTLHAWDNRFYFEYPASYQKPFVDRTALPNLISVTITSVIGNDYGNDPYIGITLLNSEYYSTDAKTMLERDLEEYESSYYYTNFELLDRSQITVSGLQGEQFTFAYTFHPDPLSPRAGENPFPMVQRVVYFSSNRVIWHLTLSSSLSIADEAKIDFEHILGTFKILQ
jgi:hypothetical protein